MRVETDADKSFNKAILDKSSNSDTVSCSSREHVESFDDVEHLLFASSCLLPVQYHDRVRAHRILSGEQKLMFAVLMDALRCYVRFVSSPDQRDRQRLDELECWFHENDESEIFSFKNLCEALGVDANVLRSCLQAARGRKKWRFRLGQFDRPT